MSTTDREHGEAAPRRVPMTNPDALVAAHGETVTLERITDAVFDDYDELDESASTIETVEINAFVSRPSEEESSRLEGKASFDRLKITVDSSVDIDSQRTGGADEVVRNGDRYKVAEVIDDTHPMTGIRKKSAILEPRPGR
jgi:hypothetical protein